MSTAEPPPEPRGQAEQAAAGEPLRVDVVDTDDESAHVAQGAAAVVVASVVSVDSTVLGAAAAEKPSAPSGTAVRYATIPLRDRADVVRRDSLRARAEAALRKHRKLPAR